LSSFGFSGTIAHGAFNPGGSQLQVADAKDASFFRAMSLNVSENWQKHCYDYAFVDHLRDRPAHRRSPVVVLT